MRPCSGLGAHFAKHCIQRTSVLPLFSPSIRLSSSHEMSHMGHSQGTERKQWFYILGSFSFPGSLCLDADSLNKGSASAGLGRWLQIHRPCIWTRKGFDLQSSKRKVKMTKHLKIRQGSCSPSSPQSTRTISCWQWHRSPVISSSMVGGVGGGASFPSIWCHFNLQSLSDESGW